MQNGCCWFGVTLPKGGKYVNPLFQDRPGPAPEVVIEGVLGVRRPTSNLEAGPSGPAPTGAAEAGLPATAGNSEPAALAWAPGELEGRGSGAMEAAAGVGVGWPGTGAGAGAAVQEAGGLQVQVAVQHPLQAGTPHAPVQQQQSLLQQELQRLQRMRQDIGDRQLEVHHSLGWGGCGVVYKGE